MRIYDAEAKDGLAEKIEAGGRISYASLASKADNPAPFGYCPECGKAGMVSVGGMAQCSGGHDYACSVARRLPPQIHPSKAVATNLNQPDLFYLSTILVSTGLNKNDDYFDRWETWRGRATAEDKQFNYEHDAKDIIGHITGTQVVLPAPSFLPFDGDEPPECFDIRTEAVLYCEWPEHPDLQKRIDKVIAEITDPPEDGGWFVSMECLFKTFDYLLIPKDGTGYSLAKSKVVDRTEKTAFLTKHLRAFGGSGVYENHKVARVLRDIVFSGKGLVRNPANPESVIFTPATAQTKIFTSFGASGYSLNSEDVTSATASEKQVEEVEKLKKQVADVTAELDKAKADNKALADDMADAKKDAKDKEDKLKDAEKKAADEKDKADAAEAKAAKAEAKLKLLSRASKVKAAYGFSTDEEALARAELLNELSDEKFDKVVAAGAADYEATKKKMYEQATKLGESKVSDLPAPMSGEPKKVGTGDSLIPPTTTPPNNTVNLTTYTNATAGATVTEQPSLAVSGANSGFDIAKAASDIAAHFEEPAEEPEPAAKKPRKRK